jgi:hypothetical protein
MTTDDERLRRQLDHLAEPVDVEGAWRTTSARFGSAGRGRRPFVYAAAAIVTVLGLIALVAVLTDDDATQTLSVAETTSTLTPEDQAESPLPPCDGPWSERYATSEMDVDALIEARFGAGAVAVRKRDELPGRPTPFTFFGVELDERTVAVGMVVTDPDQDGDLGAVIPRQLEVDLCEDVPAPGTPDATGHPVDSGEKAIAAVRDHYFWRAVAGADPFLGLPGVASSLDGVTRMEAKLATVDDYGRLTGGTVDTSATEFAQWIVAFSYPGLDGQPTWSVVTVGLEGGIGISGSPDGPAPQPGEAWPPWWDALPDYSAGG